MNADNRLRLAPSQAYAYLRALAGKLAQTNDVQMPPAVAAAVRGATVEGSDAKWIDEVAADFASHRREGAVVCVGWQQPPQVHALAHAINAALGSIGPVVQHYPASLPEESESIAALTEAMQGGNVDTLFILGGNPVYDAPADLHFADALSHVETSIHLAMLDDETSAACSWHLPRAHALESWGDHRTTDGVVSIQQPLIAPLVGARNELEMLAMIGGIRGWRGYQLVPEHAASMLGGGARFEALWRQSLHRGVVVGAPRPEVVQAAVQDTALAGQLGDVAASQGWEAVFLPSYQTFDGRYGNIPWLLEMPDPITKLVWDNAAYLSPASASELGVQNGESAQHLARRGRRALHPGVRAPGSSGPRGDAAARLGTPAHRQVGRGSGLRRLSLPYRGRPRLRHQRQRGQGGRHLRAGPDPGPPQHGRAPALHRRDPRGVPRDAEFRSVAEPDPRGRPDVDAGRLLGAAAARARRDVVLAGADRPHGASGRAAPVQVGHGDRPDDLHRLQRLHRRLPGREQHRRSSARRRSSAAARCTGSASTATSTASPRTIPQVAHAADACQQCENAPCENVCPVARDRRTAPRA